MRATARSIGAARAFAAAGLAALLTLSACSILEPRPDPTRFYVLAAPAAAPAAANGTAAAPAADVGTSLGFGPVDLPGYLARPELVRRSGDHEVVVSRVERWGEPLEAGIVRVLGEELSLLIGHGVVRYPWLPSAAPALQVAVEIARFEAVDDARVELNATLRLVRTGDGAPLQRRESITVKLPSRDGDGVATAMSEALAELAQKIVALAAQSPARPDHETSLPVQK